MSNVSVSQRLSAFFSGIFSGKPIMVVMILAGFLSGYNATTSYNNYCSAQVVAAPVTVVGGLCACCKGCVTPCEVSGTASIVRNTIYNAFSVSIQAAANFLETWLAQNVDGMVQALLTKLNDIEKNMIEWWATMWNYNLLPGMKAQTVQLNTATTDQAKTYQSSMDAEIATQTNVAVMKVESDAARTVRDNVCPPAGLTGGMGRGKTFARKMRRQGQSKSVSTGTNKVGDEGAQGIAANQKDRSLTYEAAFCDPDANGGQNLCSGTAPAEFYNADVQVSKFIYNKLTIQVDDDTGTAVLDADGNPMTVGQLHERAVKESVDNLTGTAAADPIPEAVMFSPQGQERMLDRRAFLARHNALRSIPQLAFGSRMPGSQLGQWITELREEAGIPVDEISENPSYREVMHALAVDRFNSGKFANSLMMERPGVEMEKLSMGSFYLMILRDYHDLLERMALTLAVQVAMLAEQAKVPALQGTNPIR